MNEINWTHRQPDARVVDRIRFLQRFVMGKSVIHVGFSDAGCWEFQDQRGTWLHESLAKTAQRLIGIDLDEEGVERARKKGYEAYVADCRDPVDLERLGVDPAEVVVAGEIIEHLDEPGPFLEAMHTLIDDTGALILTTPNAYSLLNPVAALKRYEIVHPDHVALYSWYTLSNVLQRHRWHVQEFLTYLLPPIRQRPGRSWRRRLDVAGAKALLGLQRALARKRAPFLADGLIAVCREE